MSRRMIIILSVLLSTSSIAYGKPPEEKPDKPDKITNNYYNYTRDFNDHTIYTSTIAVRLFDTKKLTGETYYKFGDYRETGFKITVKLGKSYADRKIE